MTEKPKPPYTALLIDDEIGARHLTKIMLERAGYKVIALPDVQKIHAHLPETDILILDNTLPEETGLELIQRLQAEQIEIPPTLLLTLRGDTDAASAAQELGVSYITKPVLTQGLLGAMDQLLENIS